MPEIFSFLRMGKLSFESQITVNDIDGENAQQGDKLEPCPPIYCYGANPQKLAAMVPVISDVGLNKP